MTTGSRGTISQRLWWLLPAWALVVIPSWYYVTGGLGAEPSDATWLAVELSLVVAGVLILTNVPEHRVGRLLLSAGLTFSAGVPLFALVEALSGVLPSMVEETLIAVGDVLLTVWTPLMIAAVAFFPTGEWPSPRFRWVGWLVWLSLSLSIAAPLVNGGLGGDNSDGSATPWAETLSPLGDVLSQLYFLSMLLAALVAASSILYRFIRSEGVQRQQMKWLALSVGVLSLGLVLDAVLGGLETASGLRAVYIGLLVVQLLAAMVIAIVRYKIYEIDRIISRAVAYVLVIGVLSALFAAMVAGISLLLPTQNSLAVAAATLAAAGLFNPLRIRVQESVDRRFNRSRYDAQQVVAAYTEGLRDQTDVSDIHSGLASVVEQTLQPATAAIWVRDDPGA